MQNSLPSRDPTAATSGRCMYVCMYCMWKSSCWSRWRLVARRCCARGGCGRTAGLRGICLPDAASVYSRKNVPAGWLQETPNRRNIITQVSYKCPANTLENSERRKEGRNERASERATKQPNCRELEVILLENYIFRAIRATCQSVGRSVARPGDCFV